MTSYAVNRAYGEHFIPLVRALVVPKSNGDGTHFIACDVTMYCAELLKDASIRDG